LAERLSSSKPKVIAIRTDVRKKADADNLAKAALAEFGKIDILVNNAGVVGDYDFLDIEEEEWDRVMDTNAKGVYLVTRAVLPHMIAARYG
jgi:NAD(P)-dependent dehydrogenase (short-subunit alcohol dehydrogenase family)